MRRREFLGVLGCVAALPLPARAQQARTLPTVGFLGTSTAAGWNPWTTAFVKRLSELGSIEGRTIAIEYRWAEGRGERSTELATDLVRLKVNVIVTAGLGAIAAMKATSTIPIVFALSNNPVGSGLVASLARPGGNVTGLSVQGTDIVGKRLELLREVLRVFTGWRSWPMLASTMLPRRWTRSRQRPKRSVSRSCRWKSGGATTSNAPSRDSRARRRGLRLRRPADHGASGSHQQPCARCAAADDIQLPGTRRSRRPDVLWRKCPGFVPARC